MITSDYETSDTLKYLFICIPFQLCQTKTFSEITDDVIVDPRTIMTTTGHETTGHYVIFFFLKKFALESGIS